MSKTEEQRPLPPRNPVIHNGAIAGAIITPLVMLMPPRKMDIRFFVLASAFSLSTNQLAYEYTGRSIYERFGNRMTSMLGSELPEGARRTQQLLREQREREAAARQQTAAGQQAAAVAAQGDEKRGLAKVLNDTWMGGEDEDWRKKRAEEHRQKLEEGKGISDIIMEQVGDVLTGNWGNKTEKKGSGETENK